MRQYYVLVCSHPHISLDDYRVYDKEERHVLPQIIESDESALAWVNDHIQRKIYWNKGEFAPKPLRLYREIKQW